MQVNFETSLNIAEVCYRNKLSLMMWGPTSSGKSSVVKELGKKLDMRVVDFRLSQTDAGELLGMPYLDDGPKGKQMRYAEPEWWPKKDEKVIIFLDELNRARNDLINSAFQLALDYEVGTRKLPKGCMVIAACNPSDDYSVNELDPAMLNRFVNIETIMEVTEFESYLKKEKLNGNVLDYIRKQPGNLFGPDYKSSAPQQQPTPRSWEKIARIEQTSGLDKATAQIMYYTILGAETATEYIAYTSGVKPISGKELRLDPIRYVAELKDQVEENISMIQITLMQYVDVITEKSTSFKDLDYQILLTLCDAVPIDLVLKTCVDIQSTHAKSSFLKINKKNDAKLFIKFQDFDKD